VLKLNGTICEFANLSVVSLEENDGLESCSQLKLKRTALILKQSNTMKQKFKRYQADIIYILKPFEIFGSDFDYIAFKNKL
jgi:hypothetical protein